VYNSNSGNKQPFEAMGLLELNSSFIPSASLTNHSVRHQQQQQQQQQQQ